MTFPEYRDAAGGLSRPTTPCTRNSNHTTPGGNKKIFLTTTTTIVPATQLRQNVFYSRLVGGAAIVVGNENERRSPSPLYGGGDARASYREWGVSFQMPIHGTVYGLNTKHFFTVRLK